MQMNKSEFEKYNTPFQRLLRNMFADSIKDEWKTNEERDLFDKFFFLLGAAEQYEVEKEMTEYIKVHPDVTIDELDDYFEEIVPPGLPPCASEWEDDEDEE